MTITREELERAWSVRNAIQARVDQEDLLAWAQRPSQNFEPVPPLRLESKPPKPLVIHFIKLCLP